ncbi:MAG: hypothetical protein HY928_18495 [Elusimicrobia bacterium]|nr:hypothetical protein [Elusimicrobiota bacterium]
MDRKNPLTKAFSAAFAAALALGPTPLYAQNMAARAAAPAVSVVPGAAGAVSLAGSQTALSLTPTLSVPGSVLPSPNLSGITVVPAAQPIAAAAAVQTAANAQAAPVAAASASGIEIRASASPVAAPAAVSGSMAAPAAAALNKEAPKGPLARVFKAVRESLRLGRSESLFTGGRTGFAPEEGGRQESEGVRLDPTPSQPQQTESPNVSWDKVQLPGRQARPTLAARLFGRRSVAPVELPGGPRDAAGVEAALRRLVQDQRGEYGGIASAQLATVLAHKVVGQNGLADTYYVNFKQLHNGVAVEGTYLGFTVKILGGKPVVIGSSANLYPWLNVDTFGRLDDRAILERAAVRLGHPTASADDFLDQGVKVMHLSGQWRAVRVMMSKSKTLMAAVDINTGETFAWDARHKLSVDGTAQGRGIADGPIESGVPSPLALGHIEIVASNGKKYYADADGKFKVEGEGTEPVNLTVRLSGKYAVVQDQERKDLVVTVTAKPGEELRVVFNPEGKDENALAQVNAYVHTTIVHDFLAKNGVDIAALNKPMPIKTNIDDECNAYYTPYSPSLNFFKSSSRCANSSYNDVTYHEYGHGVDDAAHHGIPNGGLSEAIGDMLAMLITAQPIIGRGFIKGGNPDYIRTGENTYQYRSRDEVHDQGQAGGGFAWKLRKALIASLGEAQGAAVATALILPAILASNRDIPAFINSVLMRDVNDEGVAPHYKEIAAAAAAHGIKVKEPKPGQVGPSGGYVEYENWMSRFFSAILSSWGRAGASNLR